MMQNLGYKKLAGVRVLLELPFKKKSAIELTPEMQQEIDREWALSLDKLTVYGVGESVVGYEVGDVVLVPTEELKRGSFHTINGKEMLMISSMSIALVW